MKHSGSTALALWSLVLKLSISIKHRHLNNSYVMLHIALLHCSKLFIINNKYNYFPLLSITNIIINLQSALTTDFINHHNVLLCRLNVVYAAKLKVASWNSTTVICYFDSMLSVGKLYDQGKCMKTGCRHFKPVSGWIKLFSRNGQGPLVYSVGTMPMPDF